LQKIYFPMKTATKKKSPFAKQKSPIKGMSLGEYRLMVMAKNPIKIVEKGKNVWNIKPYKD